MSFDRVKMSALVSGFVCGFAFLLTLRCPPGGIVVVHYLSLVGFVATIGMYYAHRLSRPVLGWAGAILGIIVAVIWGQFDYGEHVWRDTTDGGVEMMFVDCTYRGADTPFYREVHYNDEEGRHHSVLRFSDTFKQHGPQEETVFHPKHPEMLESLGYDVDAYNISADRTEWYWYGDQITEGEWHLRNNH